MTITRGKGVLAVLSAAIVLIILLTCICGNTITTMYFIPAGTFSLFSQGNTTSENGMAGNLPEAGGLRPGDRKLIDTGYYVYEGSPGSRQFRGRNVTVLPVTGEALKTFPELERSIHSADNNLSAGDPDQLRDIAVFKGNMSDFAPFINSVCNNRIRQECYADTAAFEYHGRYYFISEIVYDRTRPI